MRWSSLVELRGDDDSATSTVAVIRMSLEVYACVFSSHSFWTSSSLDVPAITYTEEIAENGSTAGEVANPARGQLSREHKYCPVYPRLRPRVWSRETRSAVLSRVSLLILQAEYGDVKFQPLVTM